MKLRLATLALCAVATTAATSTAFAQQGPKPEDQIRYRQSIMNVMGRQFGMLAGMAKGDVPYNKDAAVKAAGLVDTLSTLPGPLFGPGLDKGAPTKASEKVWSEPEKFKAAYEKMQALLHQGVELLLVRQAPEAAAGEVGKTCKGCHDDYREKEFRN